MFACVFAALISIMAHVDLNFSLKLFSCSVQVWPSLHAAPFSAPSKYEDLMAAYVDKNFARYLYIGSI